MNEKDWLELFEQFQVLDPILGLEKSGAQSYIFSGPPAFASIDEQAPPTVLRFAACRFAANFLLTENELGRKSVSSESNGSKSAGAVQNGAEASQQNMQESMSMLLSGRHPNLRIIEPQGRAFLAADADAVIKETLLSPRNRQSRKVIICSRFHTADDSVATKLLKVIEEPPESCIIILLAEKELAETIASRCLKVKFNPLPDLLVRRYLSEKGAEQDQLEILVESAAGDLGRAHFLAFNGDAGRRLQIWEQIPEALNESGVKVAEQVQLVRDFLEEMAASLEEMYKSEESVRREKRRLKDTETKFGFSILARHYSSLLTAKGAIGAAENGQSKAHIRIQGRIQAKIQALNQACRDLDFNPNEAALLTNLFFKLGAPAVG